MEAIRLTRLAVRATVTDLAEAEECRQKDLDWSGQDGAEECGQKEREEAMAALTKARVAEGARNESPAKTLPEKASRCLRLATDLLTAIYEFFPGSEKGALYIEEDVAVKRGGWRPLRYTTKYKAGPWVAAVEVVIQPSTEELTAAAKQAARFLAKLRVTPSYDTVRKRSFGGGISPGFYPSPVQAIAAAAADLFDSGAIEMLMRVAEHAVVAAAAKDEGATVEMAVRLADLGARALNLYKRDLAVAQAIDGMLFAKPLTQRTDVTIPDMWGAWVLRARRNAVDSIEVTRSWSKRVTGEEDAPGPEGLKGARKSFLRVGFRSTASDDGDVDRRMLAATLTSKGWVLIRQPDAIVVSDIQKELGESSWGTIVEGGKRGERARRAREEEYERMLEDEVTEAVKARVLAAPLGSCLKDCLLYAGMLEDTFRTNNPRGAYEKQMASQAATLRGVLDRLDAGVRVPEGIHSPATEPWNAGEELPRQGGEAGPGAKRKASVCAEELHKASAALAADEDAVRPPSVRPQEQTVTGPGTTGWQSSGGYEGWDSVANPAGQYGLRRPDAAQAAAEAVANIDRGRPHASRAPPRPQTYRVDNRPKAGRRN